MIYKDIDLSFSPNYYDDVASLIDIDAIKNTMLNNLMISDAERPFENSYDSTTLEDFIHSEKDQINYNDMEQFIRSRVVVDKRIISIKDIRFIDISDYEIAIEFGIVFDLDTEIETNITISIAR